MDAKKVVVRVSMHNDKAKKKALRRLSSIAGIDSMAADMKAQTITVIGNVDPVKVVRKLRNKYPTIPTSIESVGPAKDPSADKKKGKGDNNEDKKDDGNKNGDDKKDGKKKGDNKKKDSNEARMEQINVCREFCPNQWPMQAPACYLVHAPDEAYTTCSIL